MRIRVLVAFTLILQASGVTSAFAQEHAAPAILVAEDSLLFDQDLGLRVEGLGPGLEAILTVSVTDAREQAWWSQNVYIADEQGRVDLARQAPIRGTYEGVHAMGPFWSMVGADRFYTEAGADVHLRVEDAAGHVAERQVRWLSPRAHPSVTVETIRRPGLVTDLYLPFGRPEPLSVVLVVGGSGGGFNGERAALLAAHGYAALDVAYFGVEGRPPYFIETMPLDYFMGAVSILEADPRLDATRIAVMGKSYGAQLALLLASHEPRIRLVIAEAPSSFVTGTPGTYPVGPVLSAWSLDGVALPFLSRAREDGAPVSPEHISFTTSGEVALEQDPGAQRAAIPVEQINGPVLLISGEADPLWNATVMAEQLVRRMDARGFAHPVRHVSYPDAGHNLGGGEQAYGVPNLPPKDRRGRSGGTRQGNSVAGAAAWAEVLAFLQTHLQ